VRIAEPVLEVGVKLVENRLIQKIDISSVPGGNAGARPDVEQHDDRNA
jgi:hypothetical protein